MVGVGNRMMMIHGMVVGNLWEVEQRSVVAWVVDGMSDEMKKNSAMAEDWCNEVELEELVELLQQGVDNASEVPGRLEGVLVEEPAQVVAALA